MAGKFALGDVVVLKSGGVPMTIDKEVESAEEPRYRCVWQKGASHQQHVYAEHALETFVPPAKK